MNDVGYKVKQTAIIIFVLDIIGSIVLGNVFGTGYFGDDFNFAIFFTGVFSGFIFCMIIYVIGEIAELLQIISEDLKTVLANTMDHTSSQLYKLANEKTNSSSGGWICQNCHEKNDSTAQYCKSCGEYR